MIYLWKIPNKFLNRDIGEYNRERSPDRFLLYSGRKLVNNEFSSVPTMNFEIPKKRVLQFDCLTNNAQIPLVNSRVKTIFEDLAFNDVQFFKAKLVCSDGELDDYYYLNITNMITGIDHEKSIYTKMQMADAISGFKYLTYKESCMGEHQLVRDKEYEVNLLVSEKIKAAFDKEHITGVLSVRPEDFYRPLTPNDLMDE